MRGDGGHEWLRYRQELGDFVLTVDWRFTPRPEEKRYNSGIGVRLSKIGEVWYQAQTGLLEDTSSVRISWTEH